MEKKNFISLIMQTVGGILFAIGMCMCLLPQWNAFNQGVVISVIGLVVLLIMLLVRRKLEGKPVIVKLSARTVGTVLLGIIGALVLGIGSGTAWPQASSSVSWASCCSSARSRQSKG